MVDRQRGTLRVEVQIERPDGLLWPDMSARITPRTADNGVLNADAVVEAAQIFVDADLLETHHPGDFPADQDRRLSRPGMGSMYRVPERKRIHDFTG